MFNSVENSLKGWETAVSIVPGYTYTVPKRIMVSLGVPLTFSFRNYTDRLQGTTFRKTKFDPNLKLFIFCRPNRDNFISLNGDIETHYGNIYDFTVNPILITYRDAMIFGNGTLAKTINRKADLTHRFNKIFAGLYVLTSLGFTQRTSNSTRVSDVDNANSIQGSLLRKSSTYEYFLRSSFAKEFTEINTSLSAKISARYATSSSIRDNTTIHTDNTIANGEINAETEQFDRMLRLEGGVKFNLSHQKFSSDINSNTISDFGANGKITFAPHKIIEIYSSIEYTRSRMPGGTDKNCMFTDAGIRLNHRIFEVELLARNLMDKREYTYSIYRALNIINYSYSLRPREFILSLKYKF